MGKSYLFVVNKWLVGVGGFLRKVLWRREILGSFKGQVGFSLVRWIKGSCFMFAKGVQQISLIIVLGEIGEVLGYSVGGGFAFIYFESSIFLNLRFYCFFCLVQLGFFGVIVFCGGRNWRCRLLYFFFWESRVCMWLWGYNGFYVCFIGGGRFRVQLLDWLEVVFEFLLRVIDFKVIMVGDLNEVSF